MKFETKVATTTGNMPVARKIKAGVDMKNMRQVTSLMTNMYEDSALAVIREYPANARDAHVKAGQIKPIEIILPSMSNRNFVVRDCGTGMNEYDLETYYTQYAASSKLDTNDEIGGFGLGCKSALALVPKFTIITVKDGIRLHCTFGLTDDGTAEMDILRRETTTDGNGTEVIIPIPNEHIRHFDTRAYNFFLTWEPGTVLVNGKEPKTLNDGSYETVGTLGWVGSHKNYNRTITAVMGGIAYKLELNYENVAEVMGKFERSLANADIVVHAPIGSLDILPNREKLIITARTKKALAKMVSELLTQFTKQMNEKISSADDRMEAVKALEEYAFGIDRSAARWKGQVIPESVSMGKDVTRHSYFNGRRSSNNRYGGVNLSVSGSKRNVLIVDMAGNLSTKDTIVRHLPSYAKSVDIRLSEVFIGIPPVGNEWLEAMIDSELITRVTADTVSETAKAYNKAHRVQRVSNPSSYVRDEITYPVVTFADGSYKREYVNMETLRTMVAETKGTVYHIDQKDSLYFRASNAFDSYSGNTFLETLSKFGPTEKDMIIMVSAGRKLKALTGRLKDIELPSIMPVAEKALNDAADAPHGNLGDRISTSIRATSYSAHNIRQLSDHSDKLKDEFLLNVINTTQKANGRSLKDSVNILLGYKDNELMNRAGKMGKASDKEMEAFYAHYPLVDLYMERGATKASHTAAIIAALNADFAENGSLKITDKK